MEQFVKTNNTEFVFCGEPIVFRGFGVGSWLNLEHFMLGLPTLDGMIRKAFSDCYGQEQSKAFFDDFTESFLSEQDFIFLKELGVNFIRVPFNYHLLIDDQQSNCINPAGLAVLDNLIEQCTHHQIFVMLDLHAAPGGQNPDWHSENNDGLASFWQYELFRKQAVFLWKTIAERYQNYTYIMGYDLLNEPFILNENKQLLNNFYAEAIKAIREVDKNHVILLEGDFFSMDFSILECFEDTNIALTFHYYPTVWNENLLDRDLSAETRKKEFQNGLIKILKTMPNAAYPLICGEAGYELDLLDIPFGMELLKDTIDIFEARGISWCIWDYKDARFMGITRPSIKSPWMQFSDEIKLNWNHHEVADRAQHIIREIADHYAADINEELLYQTQFQLRTIFYRFEYETILMPLLKKIPWEQMKMLPSSFRLENCEIIPEYCTLIRFYIKGTL